MEFIAEDAPSDNQGQDSYNESHHPGFKYKQAMNILKPFRFTKWDHSPYAAFRSYLQ